MKNNRLLITYNESLRSNMTNGTKESLRVKSIDRAKEIVGHRDPDIVQAAVYKDSSGVEHSIV